jgi:hypothetical protein
MMFSLTSCKSKEPDELEKEEKGSSDEINFDLISLIDSWSLSYYENGVRSGIFSLSKTEQSRLIEIYNKIKSGETVLPMSKGDYLYSFTGIHENKSFEIAAFITDYEYYIAINGDMFFVPSNELNTFAAEIAVNINHADNGSNYTELTAANRFTQYRYACAEPITGEDYIRVAQNVAALWLDSLKDETCSYRLESYSWGGSGWSLSEFITAGMVDGAKEFVVLLVFDAGETGENSPFKQPAGGSYYNTYFDMYKGSLFNVRLRWENGEARILRIGSGRNVPTHMTEGLYGLIENDIEYETFFDFMNNETNQNSFSAAPYSGWAITEMVSHNATMLTDGTVVIVNIHVEVAEERDGNKVFGRAFDSFHFADGTPTYSSPVKHRDGEGNIPLEFTRGFRLLFDDYNGDGRPDFTIRLEGDEFGSNYRVEHIDSDGSPRAAPFGTEIYMAGHFDDSIRLQKLSPNSFLRWTVDRSTGEISPHIQVDDFRMYSQRFYSPGQLKLYSPETNNIICYFWNNTSFSITTGTTYDIEKRSGGNWVTVSVGNRITAQTVDAHRHVELMFDISGINAENAEYRIVMDMGGEKVYGGFFYGIELPAEITITSADDILPSQRTRLRFTIENTGVSDVTLPSTAVLGSEGMRAININIPGERLLKPGERRQITVLAENNGLFGVGEYVLALHIGDQEIHGSVILKDVGNDERYALSVSSVKQSGDGYEIELKNNHWSGESALNVSTTEAVSVLRDGRWIQTDMMNMDMLNYNFFGSDNIIEFGKSIIINFGSLLDFYLNNDEMRQFFEEIRSGDYLDFLSEEEQELFLNMTYEEYLHYIFSHEEMGGIVANVKVSSGDLCRLTVSSDFGVQFVYFTAP